VALVSFSSLSPYNASPPSLPSYTASTSVSLAADDEKDPEYTFIACAAHSATEKEWRERGGELSIRIFSVLRDGYSIF